MPDSITERVLTLAQQEGHGIVLFHDINQRTVKALPKILDRLLAEGYRFAAWDGKQFVAPEQSTIAEKMAVTSEYGESWAVVIGINDYAQWPKLQYAVNDATAMQTALIDQFGFKSDRVFLLRDGDATRNGILSIFHDKLAHGGLKKDDRVFVFYAGHGATRRLSSGRDLGYLIPVDSSPETFASDAIAMSDIQNIAESLFALAANNLGYIFYKQHKFAEALRWIKQAIAMDPSRAVAYWNLGDVSVEFQDKLAATQAFQTYLALSPNGKGAAHSREQLIQLEQRN